tara:strand:- start:81 stop:842 length:762 start_codon:yes stop_codon:yes gene_type:complete
MAYNRDAHRPLESEVSKNITDLNEKLDTVKATVSDLLNGEGAELAGVSAGNLADLEQLKLDSLQNANIQGQTLADLDLILIYDESQGVLRKTTLSNLHNGYLNSKAIHPAGSTGQLQIKSPDGIAATSNLVYKTSNNTLEVEGTVHATNINVNGSIIAGIHTVTGSTHNITEHDYTVLADTADNNIIINLPSPARCSGRILNLKKTAASNNLTLSCNSGLVDGIGSRVVKNNNSARSLQSDGTNWWIISKSGT